MPMPLMDIHSGYSFITLYLLTLHVNNLTSRSSTHWKLLGNSEILPIGVAKEHPDVHSSMILSRGTTYNSSHDFDMIMHILLSVERDIHQMHSWMAHVNNGRVNAPPPLASSEMETLPTDISPTSNDTPLAKVDTSVESVPYVTATCINKELATHVHTNNPIQISKTTVKADTIPRIVPMEEAIQARRVESSHPASTSTNFIRPSSPADMEMQKNGNHPNQHSNNDSQSESNLSASYLNCLPATNFSQYDHLGGVSQRELLIRKSEPNLALLFRLQYPSIVIPGEPDKINLDKLEDKLLQKKLRRPKSPQVYNQIGNLLRMYGDSTGAVECFRRALYLSPAHPDALLNLARVLLNHNYFADALYLVRRSLEYQDSLKSPWANHYTIGEILKAAGHHQEAAFHFKKTLEMNPDFLPAEKELQDLETSPSLLSSLKKSINVYTVFVIVSLVIIVLVVINSTMDNSTDPSAHNNENGAKSHRHFNRAMAMKALKQTMSHRGSRMKRGNISSNA